VPDLNSWINSVWSIGGEGTIYGQHPELIFLKKSLQSTGPITAYFNAIEDPTLPETLITSPITFLQFIYSMYMALALLSLYFTFYQTPVKEENTVDADYLLCSLTVEAEKEITAFDDMVLGSIILVYVFGCYFYVNAWSILNDLPEIALAFYLFPLLYLIIIGIPTILIYDFGIFFLVYLRGVGASPVLAVELMFDYIAVIIFYTRILVQGVRLVLMLFTFASLHEFVITLGLPRGSILGSEHYIDFSKGFATVVNGFSIVFLVAIPTLLVH
jgi:hypothetical protein